MKFFVTCELNETEYTDLTVEAPNERIAEAKVRSCFPGCQICNPAELIEEKNTFAFFRPYLRPFIYTNIGIFLLLFCWDVPLGKALLSAPLIAFSIFFAGSMYCELVVDRITERTKREEADLEREYSRREGYREGWHDCERKADPKFNEWSEADSRDIHPYRGPLRI